MANIREIVLDGQLADSFFDEDAPKVIENGGFILGFFQGDIGYSLSRVKAEPALIEAKLAKPAEA